MTVFYWVMGALIIGTLVPAALYGVLYVVTVSYTHLTLPTILRV